MNDPGGGPEVLRWRTDGAALREATTGLLLYRQIRNMGVRELG